MADIPNRKSDFWEADSFTFQQGKHYLVEAASGKGKTSLLSIMYGLRKDYSGKLFLDETDAGTLSIKRWSEIRKNQISYIFQGLELFDDLSAIDNILLKNNITGIKNSDDIKRMAEQLDIADSLAKKCRFLSFGQKQRVAMIRALCMPFDFLFADECFSHIDRKNSEEAMKLIIDECASRDAGLILTSLGNSFHTFENRILL